jgi:hypothetical protein
MMSPFRGIKIAIGTSVIVLILALYSGNSGADSGKLEFLRIAGSWLNKRTNIVQYIATTIATIITEKMRDNNNTNANI